MTKDKGQETTSMVIYNGEVVSPPECYHGGIVLRRRCIEGVFRGDRRPAFSAGTARFIDAAGGWILPGFVDLHSHGACGIDFNSAGVEEVLQAARFHAAGGVTALLPAVMTDAWPRMIRAVQVIRQARLAAAAPEILGVHLEGPFISPAYKGAHPEEHICIPTAPQLEEISDLAGRDLAMITLAPELPHALDAVSYLSRKGVVTALGHSGASYEQVRQAISLGLAYAVHTFSAMAGFHHRLPGALGAVLTSDELSAELVADGVHTHPAAMKLLYRAKGYDRVVLASDSSPAAGYGEGEILMAGRKVMIREGAPRLADGTLAGSYLTMNRALAGAVLMAGIPFDKAVASATVNPARVLGIENRKGSLSVGKDADVVVMNRSFEVLLTIGRGSILYNRPDQF